MKFYPFFIFLFTFHLSSGQQLDLLNEVFEDAIPSDWDHCSGNWGNYPQWSVMDGKLKEASGPYFGSVINAVLLPELDLKSVFQPRLTFDLAFAEVDSNIQFSVWYTMSDTCNTIWDDSLGGYFLDQWEEIESIQPFDIGIDNNWVASEDDFQKITIDLSSFRDSTNIRFGFVSHYRNYVASGVWYLDNLKLFGDLSNENQNLDDSFAFNMTPNPTKGSVVLSIGEIGDPVSVIITDLSDKVLLKRIISQMTEEIDLVDFIPGIYFVQCISGDFMSTKKLVIQ